MRSVGAGTVSERAPQAQVGGRRSWLASPATASALAALAGLLAAAVIPLDVLARQNVLANSALLAISLPMCAVGLIVARRQPGNPIGWLLLVIPAAVLLGLDAGPYAWLVYRMGYRLPFGPAAVLLENAYWAVLTIALPLVFLLFPDGVLPSPRWRWVLWSYLTAGADLFLVAYAGIVTIIVTRASTSTPAAASPRSITHPARRLGSLRSTRCSLSCWCSGRCSPPVWC